MFIISFFELKSSSYFNVASFINIFLYIYLQNISVSYRYLLHVLYIFLS